MKYTDRDGDVWEEQDGGVLKCVQSCVTGFEGTERLRTTVEEEFGPLREGSETPSDDLPTVSGVMTRTDIFQAAHALVQGLEWDAKANVYDVLQVAQWLEGVG
jgi:hypothetical protein